MYGHPDLVADQAQVFAYQPPVFCAAFRVHWAAFAAARSDCQPYACAMFDERDGEMLWFPGFLPVSA